MRSLLLTLILAIIGKTAAAPLPPAALTINVRQESVENSSTRFRTDWGSIGRDYDHQRILYVTLKVVGQWDREVVVEWYFIGRATNGNRIGIYGAGAAKTQTGRADAKPYVIASDFVSHYSDRYQALGLTEQGGFQPHGWVVLIWQGNRIVKATASLPEFARDFEESLGPIGAPKLD